mgnify:CR=1 FL=1
MLLSSPLRLISTAYTLWSNDKQIMSFTSREAHRDGGRCLPEGMC